MAKNDISMWTVIGMLIGLISTSLVNSKPIYTLLGGIVGAIIGYALAKVVQ